MAIKFFNIRSKEVQVAESEPHIAAMWNSSDHSPNVTQGQDFGWRLAPEVLVQMREISNDPDLVEKIARRINKSMDEVTEPDVLMYISSQTDPARAPVATIGDYQDEYDEEVRRATAAKAAAKAKAEEPEIQTATTTTTESLADMRERAELAERIAKANVTPEAPTTTTTTTVKSKSEERREAIQRAPKA